MAERLTIEQRIAAYLAENNITINVECIRNGFDVMFFQQYSDDKIIDLGEIAYDRETGMPNGGTDEGIRNGMQPNGFIGKLRNPMVRLIKEVKGDFYADRLDLIHDVIDRIDEKYREKHVKE